MVDHSEPDAPYDYWNSPHGSARLAFAAAVRDGKTHQQALDAAVDAALAIKNNRSDGLDEADVTAMADAIHGKIFVPPDLFTDNMPREKIIYAHARRLASRILRALKDPRS